MIKPICYRCDGGGVVFVTSLMRSNPSSYSDYEEVWGECPDCAGTGRAWRYMREWVLLGLRVLVARIAGGCSAREEAEIPW